MARLYGSDSSLERLNEGINKFYFGSEKTLKQESENEWSVWGIKNGVPYKSESVRIIKKGKRYRFESIN